MNKKILKIIILIFIIIALNITSISFAFSPGDLKPEANINTTEITNMGSTIATVVRTVGIIVAVIVLMIIGIKYMMGSVEEKAEYKKTMIPYVIGVVLLAGAVTIATVVVDISNGIGETQKQDSIYLPAGKGDTPDIVKSYD